MAGPGTCIDHVLYLDVRRQSRQPVPMIVPEVPFLQLLKRRWLPTDMITPPNFPEIAGAIPLRPNYALLINPFYRKATSFDSGSMRHIA